MFTDDERKNRIPENDDEYEYMEIEEGQELEDGYEYVEVDEDGNEIVDNNGNQEDSKNNIQNQPTTEMSEKEVNDLESAGGNNLDDLNPPQLTNVQLEYAYLGLLFNNPKGISVYYFKHDDCFFFFFSLENLYKIIVF